MKKLFFLLALPLVLCLAACSDDDDKDSTGSNNTVVIYENGKASNGAPFSAIDDQNFYLDNIKYSIEQKHIVVSGYNEETFNGVATIVAGITYKGKSYPVTTIRKEAFVGCAKLTTVLIPNSVTTIDDSAFENCTGLTSVAIPDTAKKIGKAAFQNCSSLITITVPKNVSQIESLAFAGCTSLQEIHFQRSSPANYAVTGRAKIFKLLDPNSFTIFVPKKSLKAYQLVFWKFHVEAE